MKPIFKISLGLILLSAIALKAQDDSFSRDITKMLELNGSAKTYDMVFEQVVMQMNAGMSGIPDSAWPKVKTEVFDAQVKSLNQKLIPIYQKHFTQQEIKAIIAFYQTEAGKSLAEKTPVVTQESMMLAQQWGMGLSTAIQMYLRENAYLNREPLK